MAEVKQETGGRTRLEVTNRLLMVSKKVPKWEAVLSDWRARLTMLGAIVPLARLR